jgi:IS5 family transposase
VPNEARPHVGVQQVRPSKRMLGDKAYDSAELREDLHERGTKPVIHHPKGAVARRSSPVTRRRAAAPEGAPWV